MCWGGESKKRNREQVLGGGVCSENQNKQHPSCMQKDTLIVRVNQERESGGLKILAEGNVRAFGLKIGIQNISYFR